ncbi:hypothetical protein ACFFQF_08075 [Haladaptatus pallidirubidus]|uniref:Uncharacterized protein n=1 Tax=Haladaptatus pallidirubidus TaxID=1008152 RepID=A0AAV3UGD6_9EURY|nr:hypothetical protein [Haladaptatus pallidirubidus]
MGFRPSLSRRIQGRSHQRRAETLAENEEPQWLHGDEEERESVLGTFPGNEMRVYPVSKRVNSPKNDLPELVEEVVADEDLQTGLEDFN